MFYWTNNNLSPWGAAFYWVSFWTSSLSSRWSRSRCLRKVNLTGNTWSSEPTSKGRLVCLVASAAFYPHLPGARSLWKMSLFLWHSDITSRGHSPRVLLFRRCIDCHSRGRSWCYRAWYHCAHIQLCEVPTGTQGYEALSSVSRCHDRKLKFTVRPSTCRTSP